MSRKKVRIGMIGYQFMGKAHSHAFRDLPFYFDQEAEPVLQAISGRNEERLKKAAEKMGWQSYETDWRRLITRGDIDVVDIATPNNTHMEMAIVAAEAGKHVICEKPLAITVEQAEKMYEAVKKNNVLHMIVHNYRFAPAVQLAKRLIDEGKIGKIHHMRATYLQDWILDPNFPLVWRLQKEVTGSGTHGDIGAHIIDLGRFLVGEFDEVIGTMKTFVKERPIGEMSGGLNANVKSNEMGKVEVDDTSAFLANFSNGALGVFEATRFAGGNRNGNRFEINGSKGTIRWDMESMNKLQVYFEGDEAGIQGFRTIHCTEEHHPFAGNYWPAGHGIGYEHTFINLMSTFMDGVINGYSPAPNFEDGLINQRILEAVEESAKKREWIKIPN